MTHLKPRPDLPFSRPVDVDRLPDIGLDIHIEASSQECAAIAAESGLNSVGALSAMFRIEPAGGRRLEVSGHLTARITEVCVVSLEPFETDVDQPIEIRFVRLTPPPSERPGRRPPASRTPQPPPHPTGDLDDDPPDTIVDGIIDLGAIAYEFLMLARDLYPRKPGVAFSEVVIGDASNPEPSAFAALQRLKDRS